jgi:hypothetical protein
LLSVSRSAFIGASLVQCPGGFRSATSKDKALLTAFVTSQFTEVSGMPHWDAALLLILRWLLQARHRTCRGS